MTCFPCVLQLGNPPHEKNSKWEGSKWSRIPWLCSGGRALRKQRVNLNLNKLSLADFLGLQKRIPVASAENPKTQVQLFSWDYYIPGINYLRYWTKCPWVAGDLSFQFEPMREWPWLATTENLLLLGSTWGQSPLEPNFRACSEKWSS